MPNYTSLVADTQTWMENTEASFVGSIDTFILNAETRLYRDLIIPQLEYEETGSLSSSSAFFARPSDLIALRYMTLEVNNEYQTLVLIQEGTGLAWYPSLTAMGVPLYYAVYDATRYRMFPAPDQNFPYHLYYRRKLPPLSDANQTNYLTDSLYDLLLAAVLCEASRFVIDDRAEGLLKMYEAKYQSALSATNQRETKASTDDYQIPFSVGTDA